MAKVPESLSIGNRDNITIESLLIIIEDLYRELAIAVNKKPDLYERTTDGQASDFDLSNGTLNINTTTSKVEMLVDRPTSTTVTWKTL